MQTLKTDPFDPAACKVAGEFLCFHKGQWSSGLPLLAAGDDETLARLAKTELAGPEDPDGQGHGHPEEGRSALSGGREPLGDDHDLGLTRAGVLVLSIGLDSSAGRPLDLRRCHDNRFVTELEHPPGGDEPGGPRFVTDPERFLGDLKLLAQLEQAAAQLAVVNRVTSIGKGVSDRD